MKKVAIEGLEQITRSISAGDEFIYVDGFGKPRNIKVKKCGNEVYEHYCRLCAFNQECCGVVNCSGIDRDNEDDVYFTE